MKRRTILVFVVLLIAGGIVYAVGRDQTKDYPLEAEHFKYGSIGTEPGVSLFSPVGGRLPPEWIFRVLPEVCPSMPSYTQLGLIYEKDRNGVTKDLPVGISRRRRLGSDFVGVNCAFCHAGTYRTAPDSPPVVVPGMPPQQIDVQQLFRHLFECIRSSDFTAENVIRAIKTAGGPSGLLDRLMYRLLIPATRSRVAELEGKLSVLTGDRIPRPGPGRLDTITPAKSVEVGWDLEERLARYGLTDLVGNMDFSPTWSLEKRKGTGKRMHWDGNLGDVHESILSAVLAVGGKPQTVDNARLQRVEQFMLMLPPPKYPFLDQIDNRLARDGKVVFDNHCAECHDGYQDGTGHFDLDARDRPVSSRHVLPRVRRRPADGDESQLRALRVLLQDVSEDERVRQRAPRRDLGSRAVSPQRVGPLAARPAPVRVLPSSNLLPRQRRVRL